MKRLMMVIIVGCLLLTAACSRQPTPAVSKVKVVTTLFPVYDFARTIAGDKAEILLLLPPGAEAHSFEPKPSDVANLARADMFVYTNRHMEPWAEKLLQGAGNSALQIVDTSTGITLIESGDEGEHAREGKHFPAAGVSKAHRDHDSIDPHIWLDFRNASKMVDTIRDGLIRIDPAHRDYYGQRAGDLKARLLELDSKYEAMLATCRTKELMSGGHFAFGYLATRYGLHYTSAYGFSPSAEPTPRDLIRLSKLSRKHGIRYLFHEELIEPRVAEAIAKETGARLILLHGAHNIAKTDFERGVTFLQLMERNYEALRTGLECR